MTKIKKTKKDFENRLAKLRLCNNIVRMSEELKKPVNTPIGTFTTITEAIVLLDNHINKLKNDRV